MGYYLKKYDFVAGLMQVGMEPYPIKIAVTATEWGKIAKEIEEDCPDIHKPTNKNFGKLNFGKVVQVWNSGSDDQGACNLINQAELGDKRITLLDFRKRERATGYGRAISELPPT